MKAATTARRANQPARPERLTSLREGIALVVYEAGPAGFALARRLRAAGYAAQVIAPSKLLAPVGPEPKSDRLDCRLATLGQKQLLRPVRVPTEQEEADRQVLRTREQLVRKACSIQQQIKAFLLQHGIAEPTGLSYWSGADSGTGRPALVGAIAADRPGAKEAGPIRRRRPG